MRRLFWLVMGITVGALVVRKMSKLAERFTARGMGEGIAAALGDLTDAVRGFTADVRGAMAEREAELRAGAGLDGELGAKP